MMMREVNWTDFLLPLYILEGRWEASTDSQSLGRSTARCSKPSSTPRPATPRVTAAYAALASRCRTLLLLTIASAPTKQTLAAGRARGAGGLAGRDAHDGELDEPWSLGHWPCAPAALIRDDGRRSTAMVGFC